MDLGGFSICPCPSFHFYLGSPSTSFPPLPLLLHLHRRSWLRPWWQHFSVAPSFFSSSGVVHDTMTVPCLSICRSSGKISSDSPTDKTMSEPSRLASLYLNIASTCILFLPGFVTCVMRRIHEHGSAWKRFRVSNGRNRRMISSGQ